MTLLARTIVIVGLFQVTASGQLDPNGGNGQRAGAAGEGPALVERFLRDEAPSLVAYRARRTLRAVNTRFNQQATVEAITELTGDGAFRYDIMHEEGSGRVRSHLRSVLRDEQRLWQRGELTRTSLSPANYRFRLEGARLDGEDAEAAIAISPLRRDVLLVDGRVIVDAASGALLRLEGRLARNPSFWTSRVDVVRHYGRIAGVRVPVHTTSVVHVKIAGRSEFEMSYDYESINGEMVVRPASEP